MAKITMVTPAARDRTGNSITAARWARRLRELGHRVRVSERSAGGACDLLVALHACKSAGAVLRFHRLHPERPIVVVLTGTDVYGGLRRSAAGRRALEVADRIVLLQPLAAREIAPHLRRKATVVYQSAPRVRAAPAGHRTPRLNVLVLAHLRDVKDPLRAAFAARLLPPASRLRVVHAGRPLTPAWEQRARAAMRRNPRYLWLGERSHAGARRLLERAFLLVISSRREGGANVVSEAAVAGVPVLASRIPGNLGLLGTDYPGCFPVGDSRALARLLGRAERDRRFVADLRVRVRRAARRFTVARERAAWRRILDQLAVAGRRRRA